MGEPSDASASRMVSSAKKSEHTVKDMSINGLIGLGTRAVAEVSRPASQEAIQLALTTSHAPLLPGLSKSLTFLLIRSTLFLDGAAPRYQRPPFGKRQGPSV